MIARNCLLSLVTVFLLSLLAVAAQAQMKLSQTVNLITSTSTIGTSTQIR